MSITSKMDFHGNRVVEIEAVTTPPLRKGNPWGLTKKHNLRKVARIKAMVGPEGLYQWLVNIARQLLGQPVDPTTGEVAKFHALPANWGEYARRADGTSLPYVTYEGNEYLPVSVICSLDCEYRTVDGKPVTKETVAEWLPERQEGRRQELPIDRVIRWRRYRLDHVESVKIGDELYEGLAKDSMKRLLKGETSVVN